MAKKSTSNKAGKAQAPAKLKASAEESSARPQTNATRACLILVLLAYLVFAIAYATVTPTDSYDQHNPDEVGHMYNVATVASGHLPVFDIKQDPSYEAHQPPLYYFLCAPVYLASQSFGPQIQMRAVRCVSTAVIAVAIVFAFLAVGMLFADLPWVAVGVALFLALLPGVLGVASSVSNDSLTILVMILGAWLCARICVAAQSGKSIAQGAVWLGVLLGLGEWTKTLTLLLFPTVALLYLLLAYKNALAGGTAAKACAVSIGLGLLIGLPIFIRNTVLYGDPLAQHLLTVTLNDGRHSVRADTIIQLLGSFWTYLAVVFKWSFAAYWGQFDSMRFFWNVPLHATHMDILRNPGIIYQICALFSLACLPGLFIAYARFARSPARWCWLGAQLALIAFTTIAFLKYNLTYFQAQGRYWYPALFPFTLFFILGWRALCGTERVWQAALVLLAAALLALNIYTLILLHLRFAGA